MTHKIIVAKTGYDALTETDPNNLNYSSDYNTLKYFYSGTLTKSVTAAAGTTASGTSTYTHSLGVYPYFVPYLSINGTDYYPQSYTNAGASVTVYVTSYVTTTTLVLAVRIENFSGGDETVDATCKFKLFRNDVNI